ncbi:MAG: DNA-binding protein [Prevotellaceae bacterium]|nr:DNA-binding protein [Prevotellaceae bacterium]
MIEFIIKSRVQPLGSRKGRKVYYASQKVTHTAKIDSSLTDIVQRTSLAKGDMLNALVSLAELVCENLSNGQSADLGPLGSLRVYVPSKMMDTPEEVTVEGALKKPHIVFYPTRAMLKALAKIRMRIDRG